MRLRLGLALALAVTMSSGSAQANDFVDTRISFSAVHENMLVKPGETNPSIPGFRIGAPLPSTILFFDNYDTRFTGYENLTHLVLYKVKNWGRATVEAGFVLRLLQFTDVSLSSLDDGSYIRLQYFFDPSRTKKTNIAVTLFPLSADRMRLGYSYRLSWGGSPIFFKFNPDNPSASSSFSNNNLPAPGLKLQLSGERYYAYVGFKTAILLNRNPTVNEQQAVYAGLAGFGVDVVKNHFRIEGNGGYFDRGNNPLFYGTTVGPQGMTFTDYPVASFGGTLQLSIFSGLAPTQSIDFMLYRNDPLVSVQRLFARPVYAPGFNWLISTEWTAIGSTLQDLDKPNSTKIQPGYAGDVNLRFQFGKARVKADFAMRSLSYMLVNVPSLVPFQDFPKGARVNEEIFGALGFDYFIERIGMTVGVTAGVERPATFTPPGGQGLPPELTGTTGSTLATPATLVVRGEGDFSILPTGEREAPIAAGKLEIREDFMEHFAALLQLNYQYDPNQTRLLKAPDGTSLRTFANANRLGIILAVQAKF